MQVLIVDDDSLVRQMLAIMIEGSGPDIQVIQSGTVDEGMQVLWDRNIGLAIIDFVLPDRSGIDMLREMDMAHLSVPSVIVTGVETLPPDIGYPSFYLGWLRKPILREQIRDIFRSLAARAKAGA